MRVFRYLILAKIALAIDTQPGQAARLAICACNPKDSYSRPAARFILNSMLDQTPDTLRVLGVKSNVFSLPYYGNTPVRDILLPLLSELKPLLESRMTAFKEASPKTKLALPWKARSDAVVAATARFVKERNTLKPSVIL